MKVRVNILNKNHEYKIGNLVKAKISCDSLETLWVPASSVVDLGKNKIIWLWESSTFISKKVETGMVNNGWIEVTDGLTENSQVASEAHYLTDSEGFIKINK
jgi:Cu(I)/Ag(I) efflux system membrane fusion protein